MRKNQGITLVALIITIIIMLVLVAVSVNVIVKSNLIGTAEKAANGYKTAYERENDGSITINGKIYNSLDEYEEEINQIIVEPEDIKDWGYTVENDGTVTLNYYKGKDTEVVIPNYINGNPVKKIGHTVHSEYNQPYQGAGMGTFWDISICSNDIEWYWAIQRTITKVVITEGIEEIDPDAFNCMQVVEEFVLPKSLKKIDIKQLKWRPYANNITTNTKIIIPFAKDKVPETWEIPSEAQCEQYEFEILYLK